MDNELFGLLAKFTVRARRITGHIDTTQMLENAEYRAMVFDKVEAEGDDEMLTLMLMLKDHIQNPRLPIAEPEKPAAEPTDAERKYVFGTRG
jgi:hypothetical protein